MVWTETYTIPPTFVSPHEKHFKFPFFRDTLKFPLLTFCDFEKRGCGKAFELYLVMGKLHKYRDIHAYRVLDLSLLNIRMSRNTYHKRVNQMVELGLAAVKDGNLSLRKLDKVVTIEGEKFIRVTNDKKVIERIYTEILKREIKQQQYRCDQSQKVYRVNLANRAFSVLTKIGEKISISSEVPDYISNMSCIGISELFGRSSSYFGWNILNKLKEAGFIAIYKRYVPIEDTYVSKNWKRAKNAKPILVVNEVQVNPIASVIEIKMNRCKRGESGLNNPKYYAEHRINNLYGDTWG